MSVNVNFIVIVLAGYVSANSLLPVEKCNLVDSKCMQKAMQDAIPVFVLGLPEVGTDVLDVMDIPLVAYDLLGLQFKLTEGKLDGLRNVVIDNVKFDLIKKKIEMKFHLDCNVTGNCFSKGKVLMLPISGDGPCTMEMKNLSVKWVFDFDIKKNPQGKDIVALTKYTVDFEVLDYSHFEASNLFNGNKKLSDAMMKFLNENWKEVISKFGRPLIEVSSGKIIKNIKKYLAAFPIEDIAIYNA